MPARAALNAYYAWITKGMDGKQRKQFDDQLYGWNADNEAATAALFNGGGED